MLLLLLLKLLLHPRCIKMEVHLTALLWFLSTFFLLLRFNRIISWNVSLAAASCCLMSFSNRRVRTHTHAHTAKGKVLTAEITSGYQILFLAALLLFSINPESDDFIPEYPTEHLNVKDVCFFCRTVTLRPGFTCFLRWMMMSEGRDRVSFWLVLRAGRKPEDGKNKNQ